MRIYPKSAALVAPLAALALAALPAPGRAQYTGPTPYLSFADSPFNGPAFTTFFLEDFEDGALNTSGVTVDTGIVLGPGVFTDSVDGDDGALNGTGAGSHSFYNGATGSLTFTFSAAALGGLPPTHAGIVWTDVGASATPGFDGVSFEAFDAASVSLGIIGPFLLGDGSASGQTAEDRFFGVTNAGGISAIRISMATSTDWEVDHLQYGRIAPAADIPEPATSALAASGLLPLAGIVLRSRKA